MNILSLDGGGVRGIISIKILNEIMNRINQHSSNKLYVHDIFDYFSGSSIGSVIICALLLPNTETPNKPKYDTEDILKLIKDKSNNLFELEYFQNLRTMWGFLSPKYVNDNRPKFFKETFGEIEFGKLIKPVVFPCGDLISNQACYFHTNDEKINKFKIWEILLGTTAAPSYFPSKQLIINGQKTDLIDSGCIANDTSHLAFAEAMNHFKGICPPENLYELSIGTGLSPVSYNSHLWGALQWLPILADMFMSFNAQNQQYEWSLTTNENQRDRINPLIPYEINYMDCPQYIPKYIEIVDKWILDNNDQLNSIVNKLMSNKGLNKINPVKDLITKYENQTKVVTPDNQPKMVINEIINTEIINHQMTIDDSKLTSLNQT